MSFSIRKNISSLKIRTVILFGGLLWILVVIANRVFRPRHKFTELRENNIENQWENIETVLVASRHHRVPLLLFDIDILPNIFVARERSWKDTLHKCKVLCKHHPEEKNVITFAALASKFLQSKDEFMEALNHLGFVVYLSEVVDPRSVGGSKLTPSYLWMARNDHIIHVTFLHERGDKIKYLWVAPVSDREWKKTVQTLAPALSDGWHSLEAVGAKFPRYAQAYDMSHRFTGLPVHLDGHRISVPYHITSFLKEYSNSRFIECGQSNLLRAKTPESSSSESMNSEATRSLGKVMLTDVKQVMDEIDLPFWITGGTLLGWYRQCNFIHHDSELDIAIWGRDFKQNLPNKMKRKGYTYKFNVDALDNGDDVHFLNENGNKVNFLLFNQDENGFRNVRMRNEDGRKFLLTYPTFNLCWTEFVGNKVQVPCDSLSYLKSYFGEDWNVPNEKWIWHLDAANKIAIDNV